MSQALLFSIGVGVFAMTIVAAMIFGRQAFDRAYQVQVADAQNYANLRTAAAAAAAAPTVAVASGVVENSPLVT